MKCKCANCGKGCAGKGHEHPAEEKPVGFFAARPWVWIVLGYTAFLAVMFTFVWIAQTHANRGGGFQPPRKQPQRLEASATMHDR